MTEQTDRPDGCCGVCPGIVGGGYDCTCADNPDCPLVDPVALADRWYLRSQDDDDDLGDVSVVEAIGLAHRLATENGERSGNPGKLPATDDVVERARQAVDAWDRFAVWAPTRVPGVRVCLDLVRDLLAEVERLRGSRDDALAELVGLDGLLSERDARIARLRTDLARMTEQAEAAILELRDVTRELDAAHGDLAEARAVIDRVQALHSQGACSCGYEHVRLHIGPDCEPMCNECGPGEWPCATIRALDGEVSGE